MLHRPATHMLMSAAMLFTAALPTWAQKGHEPDTLTREELAAAWGTALGDDPPGLPPCVPGQEMFDDVPASNPFCEYIEELARRAITGGCTPTKYCPGSPVTRSQMAAFLVRTHLPTFIPRGVTVVGRWGFDVDTDGSGDWGTSISFGAAMNEAPQARYLGPGENPTNECPGSVAFPAATPGFLCVYASQVQSSDFSSFLGISRHGATIFFRDEGPVGDMFAYGTWAATAATFP